MSSPNGGVFGSFPYKCCAVVFRLGMFRPTRQPVLCVHWRNLRIVGSRGSPNIYGLLLLATEGGPISTHNCQHTGLSAPVPTLWQWSGLAPRGLHYGLDPSKTGAPLCDLLDVGRAWGRAVRATLPNEAGAKDRFTRRTPSVSGSNFFPPVMRFISYIGYTVTHWCCFGRAVGYILRIDYALRDCDLRCYRCNRCNRFIS